MPLKILMEPKVGLCPLTRKLIAHPTIKSYSSFFLGIRDHAKMIHFNWLDYNGIFEYMKFYFKLITAKLFRLKIIYTVHNTLPHVIKYYSLTYLHCYIFDKFCDFYFFFSKNDKGVYEKLFRHKIKTNFKIIHYGPMSLKIPMITKDIARNQLSLEKDAKILTYFGNIWEYKGVDDLIIVFRRIQEKRIFPNIKLIIIGRIKENNMKDSIERLINKVSNVKWIQDFIPDEELAAYLLASDVLPMPFRRISNSSTFCLGKRFPARLVAPLTGSLPEHDFYGHPAVFYKVNNLASLENALVFALQNPLDTLTTIDDNIFNEKWDDIIQQFIEIYQKLIYH